MASNELRWSIEAAYGDYPRAAVRDGLVYGVCRRDGVHAVDLQTGESRWFVACTAVTYGPTVTDDAVYFATSAHELLAVDRSDASLRWRAPVPAAVYHAPTVAAGTVLVRSHRGKLTAIDVTSGAVRWSAHYPGNGLDLAAPLVIGDRTIVPYEKGLASVDIATGERLGGVEHCPLTDLLDDGTTLYSYSSALPSIHVHDRETLAVQRTIELDPDTCYDTYGDKAIAVDGTIYTVAPYDQRLAAVDTTASRPQSVDIAGIHSEGAPAVHGGLLLVTPAKELVAIDRKTHAVSWRRPCPMVGFVAPSLVIGGVAIVVSEGRVSAVELPST